MKIAFKGFEDWVEIFAGGRQTDCNGRVHDGDALIESAVAGFDPSFHEPPAVIGHPSDDAPAFGLVEALKVDANGDRKVLLARFRDVHAEFADMVKQGRFPKRSAAFYPDGRLRHVGFLGAMPPAVKGLKNIAFAAGQEASVFEFADPRPWTWGAIGEVFRRLREYFIEKEGTERADKIIPEWNIQDVTEEQRRAETHPQEDHLMTGFAEFFEAFKIWKKVEKDPNAAITLPAGPAGGQFSEADLKAAEEKAAAKAKAEAAAAFAEEKRKAAKDQRDKDIGAWVDAKVDAGVIAPALRDGGMTTFMQGLDDTAIQFAEGAAKQSPLDWFKGFVDTLGASPLFKEIATKTGAAAKPGDAEAEIKIGQEIAARANR